jgi:hypothetical protein
VAPDAWPAPPDRAAYHGLLGEVVDAVAEHTEADPVGILGSLLAMFGTVAGPARSLYQGSMQRANLFFLLVGETGFGGRKGTALDIARFVFDAVYPGLNSLWLVGVASGEGIVGHLAGKDADAAPDPRCLVTSMGCSSPTWCAPAPVGV